MFLYTSNKVRHVLPFVVLVSIAAACTDGVGPGTPGGVVDTTVVDTAGVAPQVYVSRAGSDYNPGSEARPFRTIRYALTRLQPGQTLLVRGGTYTENIRNPVIRPGRPDARITVAAYPGERVVVAGLVWLTRPSYWTIDGINVTWSTANSGSSHMVKISNGIGWTYQNSELWGARSFAAILVYGSAPGEPGDWTLRNNCVHDTYATNASSQDHNLYINTGGAAGRGLIERNVIFNAPNGENIKLGYGSTYWTGVGTANVTVRYNTMHGALKNLMLTDDSHDNVIERNIVSGTASDYFMRAYKLRNTTNVLRDNVLFGAGRLQYADAGYSAVTDGGGNVLALDPQFDAVACDGFRPQNPDAQAYGRWAP